MITTTSPSRPPFSSLDDLQNQQHPLYKFSSLIDWKNFEIMEPPKAGNTCYQRKKKHKLFCKRTGIGHLKTDYRLGCNFYKGVFGGAINVTLAAAACNFKRAMKVLLWLVEKISETLFIRKVASLDCAF